MKKRSHHHGFTLVELMVSMGMVAILLAFAVPSVSSMIKNNRLSTQLNAVMNDIHFARSEAIKRGTRIVLCRSANPNLTTPSCGGSNQNWSTGYLIFTGEDGNNTYQAGTDTLLGLGQPAQEGITLLTTATWNNNLEINTSGTLNEGGTAIMALCDSRNEAYGRQITIPLTGIPKLLSTNISDCSP